jgi:hypothetical protein
MGKAHDEWARSKQQAGWLALKQWEHQQRQQAMASSPQYTEGVGYKPGQSDLGGQEGLLLQNRDKRFMPPQKPMLLPQRSEVPNFPRKIGLIDDASQYWGQHGLVGGLTPRGLMGRQSENAPAPVNHQAALEDAIDKYFPDNLGAKAALMSQAFHENNTFDPNREEDENANNRERPKGLGIFQFTDQYDSTTGQTKPGQRAAFEKYLQDTGLPNSADTQVGYYKKLSTTTDDAWAKKYHDIGAGHRQRNRLTFEAGDAFGISQHLTASVERPQNWGDKLVPRALSAQEWQKNYEPDATLNFKKGPPQPMQMMEPQMQMAEQKLKLGSPSGWMTDEGNGRRAYNNNFGGYSTEYSIGVKHPGINNGELTHIPSIYDGRIVDQSEAENIILQNKGFDPETGRFITPGGDPEARSKNIKLIKEVAYKPDKAYRQSQQPQYGNAGGGYTDAEMAGLVARSQAKGLLNSR